MPLARIVGHSRVIDLLRRAVARDSVPQSLIFAGPEGVWKRATAIALAQAVNCPQAREGDACGACNTCRRIAAGTFSDVVLLDKGDEASIKLDPLREKVLQPVGYRPFEGRRRVFIIDPADELTSQDALLKTLEEPPPSAILILVTAYPDLLLGTIQSRCRRVRFGPLSQDEVVRVLVDVERIDEARARHLAVVSGGSVARALASDEKAFLGDRQAAVALLHAARERRLAPRLKAAAAFAQVEKKRRARDAAFARLAILGTLLRDIMVLGTGSDGDSIFNTDLRRDLERLAQDYPEARLAGGFAAVQQAEQSIDRNASPKIVADWLAVRL